MPSERETRLIQSLAESAVAHITRAFQPPPPSQWPREDD